MAHPVGTITQPRVYMPLSGRRYGSFAGRSVFTASGDADSSFVETAFPKSSFVPQHIGRASSSFRFSLVEWLTLPRLAHV